MTEDHSTLMQDTFDNQTAVLQHLRIPVWVFDVDYLKIVWANNCALDFWQADSSSALYSRDMSLEISNTVRHRLRQMREDCVRKSRSFSEHWTLYPNGAPQTAEVVLSPIKLADQRQALLVHLLYQDTHSSSDTLHSAQALLHTSAMISLYNTNLELVYCNPAARSISTHESQALHEKIVHQRDLDYIQSTLDMSGECNVELEVHTAQGIVWHAMNIQLSPDSVTGAKSILVSATDVTERRIAQQKAFALAYTDSLTGLANRIALLEYLRTLCAQKALPFTVLFLDLDRFKLVNDSLGHNVGDSLLLQVAKRLKRTAEPHKNMVSRLGGDEFVVVMSDITSPLEIKQHTELLLSELSQPFNVEGHQLRISPSVGICQCPEDANSTTGILQCADMAMYVAKASNAGYCFYNPNMNKSTEDRLRLENDLAEAVKHQQFQVYYQPKICAHTNQVTGMEALIRWDHPERGLINPIEFISVAEETGLIIKMGHWVMLEAMRQQRQWKDIGFDVCVSINISPVQFMSSNLADIIADAIDVTGCDSGKIEFEITESMLLGDAEAVFETLNTLSRRGVRLAIDDFGTGYSNLAYLQKYPLSCLKIDRAFLADMEHTAILDMILRMGQVLGLSVVAEGVETVQQIDWLKKHGCDELQGFFFSRPLPKEQATAYLRAFDYDLQYQEVA